MTNKYSSELNKKAFTLIELLISVTILVLIFTFIYGQFNLAQLSTKKTTQIESSTTQRGKIITLLYNDFITTKEIVPTSGKSFDKFINAFETNNSLHGISNPFVKYAVIETNDGKFLMRAESNQQNISFSENNNKFYMDEIVKNIEFFKVITNDNYIEFFIKAKDMKDIYFRFKKIK